MVDPMEELAELSRILSQKPDIAATLFSVAKALVAVECGERTIKMQAGKPVWVDKTERERVGRTPSAEVLATTVKGMKKIIPIMLTTFMLSSCAPSRDAYMSEFYALTHSLIELNRRIVDYATELERNPQLWHDDNIIQQAVTLCEGAITTSSEVDDLRPPESLETFHKIGVEMLGEIKAFAEDMKLGFSTGDAKYQKDASAHLDTVSSKMSELGKEKEKRRDWYGDHTFVIALLLYAIEAVYRKSLSSRLNRLSWISACATLMAILLAGSSSLNRHSTEAVGAALYAGGLAWLLRRPSSAPAGFLIGLELLQWSQGIARWSWADHMVFMVFLALTTYHTFKAFKIVRIIQEQSSNAETTTTDAG